MKPLLLTLLLLLSDAGQGAPVFIDAGVVMKLAGARHEEVALARARHAEAVVTSRQAWQKFWPSFSLAVGYRGHEGRVQDIAGAVFDARKQQYTAGGMLLADWAPGDLYYGALAARQQAAVQGHLVEKARRDLVLRAVASYYRLLEAEAVAAAVTEEVAALADYAQQLGGLEAAGTVLRADLLRVRAQLARSRLLLVQEEEQVGLAAAALAEVLRIPAATELRAAKADLVPVRMVGEAASLGGLVAEAMGQRPELKAQASAVAAAASESDRARRAPWIPRVQAGYSLGGLGGGFAGDWGNFGDSQDFYLGLGWTIGPGGLFDRTRVAGAGAREEVARLERNRLEAAVGREVVEAAIRVRSAGLQVRMSAEAVAAAREMMELARQRTASGVGVVFEYLLAREEFTRSRRAEVRAIAGFNAAQHALQRAVGR
jgi:outer membrane protein TolC